MEALEISHAWIYIYRLLLKGGLPGLKRLDGGGIVVLTKWPRV
jgi:hypothetical protein